MKNDILSGVCFTDDFPWVTIVSQKGSCEKTGSASAAYWLGRAYSQNGNNKEAYKYYEKAFKLKPNKKKYRKAYMKSKRLNYDISEEDD